MNMMSDTPLLTFTQLREWEARVLEIDASIKSQTEERATLTRKIDAARVLVETLSYSVAAESELSEEAAPKLSAGEESISDVILAAAVAVKPPAKAVAMRKWIATHNPGVSEKLDANPAYFYTTLSRHVKAGRLSRRGKIYRVVQSSAAKAAETGGVAPPIPSTSN